MRLLHRCMLSCIPAIHDAPALERAGSPCMSFLSCQPRPAGMSGSALQHKACNAWKTGLHTSVSPSSSELLIQKCGIQRVARALKHKRSAAHSNAIHACKGVQSRAPDKWIPTRNNAPPEHDALLRRRRAGPAPGGTRARGLRGRMARGSWRLLLAGPSLPGAPGRSRGARAAPARAT